MSALSDSTLRTIGETIRLGLTLGAMLAMIGAMI